MKKCKVKEFSPAWFIKGMGPGVAGIGALYGCMLLLVKLANNGVI